MNYFKPPITECTDHYDVIRFNLTWNLCLALCILLSLLAIANFHNDNYTSLTNIIEVGVGVISLIILKKTRKYKIVCIFATVSSFLLVSIAFFTIVRTLHYTTPMWGTVVVLFAFLMLGRVWGLAILIGHFTVLIFYYVFRIELNINTLPDFDTPMVSNFIIETCIVGMAMAYLLTQFIKANHQAEKFVKTSNTELTKQNEVISVQNREKEVMLKEIHHRVKNNLQVITSLLRLQSYELKGEEADTFTEAINRVKSMALIHDQMYQSDMISNFDLKNYLVSLTKDLIATYSVKMKIKLNVKSDIRNIGSKSIVPISLMFNELISNSIKHGFEDKKEGVINVHVSASENEDYLTLKYSDNGTWKADIEKSFGIELIDTMMEQLEGERTLEKTDEGTFYTFSLKALAED
jgi:two-component sensor histidine kinase